MQIYINRNGERTGPLSIEEVNRRLAAGLLQPTDQGWTEDSPGWKPLLSFTGVIMPGGASSTAAQISLATPITFGLVRYAGFWIRAVAFIIDAIILVVVFLVIAFFLTTSYEETGPARMAAVLQSVITILYLAVFWASPLQATPGQRMCGLQVVDEIGARRISFMRALGRALALLLSGLLLGIGYLMVAFTERKRGLHDMIAGTCVMKDAVI
jgi:uncharacterized RDD family membrane protein YckC